MAYYIPGDMKKHVAGGQAHEIIKI